MELDGVVDRLLAHRAELSPIELDRIKRRVAGTPRNLKRETERNMKTRTSILALLASGVILSTGGAALGVSGLAGSSSAGNVQYPETVTTPTTTTTTPTTTTETVVPTATGGGTTGGGTTGGGTTGGEVQTGEDTTAPVVVLGETETQQGTAAAPAGGTAGESASEAPVAVAQPTAQQSLDSEDELPFTGFAAIPLLLLGLGLLGAGLVLRRRSANDLA